MSTAFFLTSGDGSDGDEWHVIGVYSSFALAEIAKAAYSQPQKNIYGGEYIRQSEIEEWQVDLPVITLATRPIVPIGRKCWNCGEEDVLVECPICGVPLPGIVESLP